jgi:hypothetical protein
MLPEYTMPKSEKNKRKKSSRKSLLTWSCNLPFFPRTRRRAVYHCINRRGKEPYKDSSTDKNSNEHTHTPRCKTYAHTLVLRTNIVPKTGRAEQRPAPAIQDQLTHPSGSERDETSSSCQSPKFSLLVPLKTHSLQCLHCSHDNKRVQPLLQIILTRPSTFLHQKRVLEAAGWEQPDQQHGAARTRIA